MKQLYPGLMKPIKIRNTVLKNRLMSSTSMPHFISGPEQYPNDHMIWHLSQRAKNGAAVVTVSHTWNSNGRIIMPTTGGDADHFPGYDMWDPLCQNYLTMLADAIHYYGSKACMALALSIDFEYGVCADEKRGIKEMPPEQIEKNIDLYVEQCVTLKKLGFDMGSVQMAYRLPFVGEFFSAVTNHRTDEFGGSLENRAKVPVRLFQKIREAVGDDFLIEAVISADEEPLNGNTFEEICQFVKMIDGLVDIVQVRLWDGDPSHPMGFTEDHYPTLKYTKQLKQLNLKHTVIAAIGGFQNPDDMETALEENQTDLFAGARLWMADTEYGKKLAEGRPEDIIPCIRCNRCHVISHHKPYLSMCSVNPEIGIQNTLPYRITKAERKKKVAVVGGGPGGMRAALIAADRGHEVTLYEKSGILGGQLNAAVVPEFKWPLKNYLEWLRLQIKKSSVNVKLHTIATPQMILEQEFDAVIAAVGAVPVQPSIEGIDTGNVLLFTEALLDASKVTGTVAVIGGGEIGCETAIYLAKAGHKTTVLEMKEKLAAEADIPHVYSHLMGCFHETDNLEARTSVKVVKIDGNKVIYEDEQQKREQVEADTIILAAGTKACLDEGMQYYGIAPESFVIGDCTEVGNLMYVNRQAFAAASQL